MVDASSTRFPRVPESAAAARRYVAEMLQGWEFDESTIDTARLLTSEVVTNALRHARSDVRVVVQRQLAGARIEVTDHGPGAIVLARAGSDDLHGRGLRIVGRLAAAWGDEHRPDGDYCVWFEVGA